MVEFRKAAEGDCELYFAWRQDEGVREVSFSKEELVYQHHVQWFKKKLADSTCLLLVALEGGLPCGQIRFDLDGNTALISFSVAAEFRGRGIAKIMLSQGAELCRKNFGTGIAVQGVVMEKNIPSLRAFIASGYQEVERFKRDDIDCIRFQAP